MKFLIDNALSPILARELKMTNTNNLNKRFILTPPAPTVPETADNPAAPRMQGRGGYRSRIVCPARATPRSAIRLFTVHPTMH